MATRPVTSLFNQYRNQRYFIISLVFVGFIISVILSVLALFIYPNVNILQSIAFFFLILFVGGVIYARQLLISVNMRFHYHRMIDENVPPLRVKTIPFQDTFHPSLIKEGYELVANKPSCVIYVKIYKTLPYVKRTGPTLVWLIHLLDDTLRFHDGSLDEEINYIKEKKLTRTEFANELSLIFKKTSSWQKEDLISFQEIINFSIQNRALISLPVAILEKKHMIYTLRPIKQYPNKYYYALIKILDALCETKEVIHGR